MTIEDIKRDEEPDYIIFRNRMPARLDYACGLSQGSRIRQFISNLAKVERCNFKNLGLQPH